MQRIVIFGNSGSGKTTLAKRYSAKYNLAHLDLDTLAWLNTSPPQRKLIEDSSIEISRFLGKNSSWVVEGCYADLLSLVMKSATKIIFLNPGVDICIENCKNRPWEPHKYASLDEQNININMLLNWVKEYISRTDEFSFESHKALYESFQGEKKEIISNQ